MSLFSRNDNARLTGYRDEAHLDQVRAENEKEDRLIPEAVVRFQQMEPLAFRREVEQARIEHPRWWTNVMWIEFVKNETQWKIACLQMDAALATIAAHRRQ